MRKHGRKSQHKKEMTSASTPRTTVTDPDGGEHPPDSDDDARGFAGWLRSSEGFEMLRLFVIANSVILFLTMTMPQMQQAYDIIKSFITGDDDPF